MRKPMQQQINGQINFFLLHSLCLKSVFCFFILNFFRRFSFFHSGSIKLFALRSMGFKLFWFLFPLFSTSSCSFAWRFYRFLFISLSFFGIMWMMRNVQKSNEKRRSQKIFSPWVFFTTLHSTNEEHRHNDGIRLWFTVEDMKKHCIDIIGN